MKNTDEFVRYLKRPTANDNERRACANINSDNPMGAILNYGAALSKKEFLKDIPEKFSKAHESGWIHIHDLDFYDLTTTCCQISLDQLFQTGFGNMRPPKRIQSAFMQMCIAIQSNQNDQYGGQSIIDYDIALGRLAERVEKQYTINGDTADCAEQKVLKEIRQGAEAMIHNLNTMNSRAGAQVPFSSINYGMGPATLNALGETRAAFWASQIILHTFEATMFGLANGETARYPIQIYRVKNGVNLTESDPYYDLTISALECTAKRAYPNYLFMDNAGNDIGFDISKPKTHVGTMGCAEYNEVIIYRDDIRGDIFCESIGRAYERATMAMGGEYSAWDSYNDCFSKIKTWIKNPKTNDFWDIKISNGRCLTLTSDHPLPIEGKGRTYVEDIVPGDEIKITKFIPSASYKAMHNPWFIGFSVCDASYNGSYMACIGMDEIEIFQYIKTVYPQAWLKEQHRGEKGDYFEIHIPSLGINFEAMFGGLRKIDRQLPCDFLMWNREDRLALLAGIIDANGYINNRGHVIQIGSTNKELSLQQLYLCLSLCGDAQIYENHYNSSNDKIRYRVECNYISGLEKYLQLEKKIINGGEGRPHRCDKSYIRSIEEAKIFDHSYDLETETDRFDLSGVYSHNCRTRVYSDLFGESTSYGRGNASFCTINLPRLGILSTSAEEFWGRLNYTTNLVADQLQYRLTRQSKRPIEAYPSLVGDNIGIDAEECKRQNSMWPMLKHFTLSVGFIGVYECLRALRHNGITDITGLDIVKALEFKVNRLKATRKLNYSLLATPAESVCERFLQLDRKKFGVIPQVTDRGYYTNSFNVPVFADISVFDKLWYEGQFHKMCNAGHITTVEIDGDVRQNIKAMESILKGMYVNGIGYGAFNVPLDHCTACHYDGYIPTEGCPVCGNTDILRMRRITGYLAYLDRFNDGKRAEERERVKHSLDMNATFDIIPNEEVVLHVPVC